MLPRISFSLILAGLVLVSSSSQAAVPQLINFQGRLTNDAGDTLDTTVAMVFSVYDAPSLGGVFWRETQTSVAVVGGTFNIFLGSVEPLHDSVFRFADRYLGVKVGDDPELTPRTRLVSVAYAHRASTVDGASGGAITSQVAIGTFHETSGPGAFVAGDHNAATGDHATVSGGKYNKARGRYATVGGGGAATPGDSNLALGEYSTIAGGYRHLTSGQYSTIGGGDDQTASGDWSTISGGQDNATTAQFGTVAGGQYNLASGAYATIAGGVRGVAGGHHSFVAGGTDNTANGDYSFAAGRFATVAAAHEGAILLADSTAVPFNSVAGNEFAVRCTGGARMVTAVDGLGMPAAGACLTPGSGSWASCSDRNAKENVVVANGGAVLDKLAGLPISVWSYKSEPAVIRHIGPMAQDFYEAFGLGADERHITAIDADGVALAAIKELHHRMADELAAKDRTLAALESRLAELQAAVTLLLDDARAAGRDNR
jgi:hypothetical protein